MHLHSPFICLVGHSPRKQRMWSWFPLQHGEGDGKGNDILSLNHPLSLTTGFRIEVGAPALTCSADENGSQFGKKCSRFGTKRRTSKWSYDCKVLYLKNSDEWLSSRCLISINGLKEKKQNKCRNKIWDIYVYTYIFFHFDHQLLFLCSGPGCPTSELLHILAVKM